MFLLAAMPVLVAASERSTMPKGYLGDWSIGRERCAPGPGDNNNIRITVHRIREFERYMDVRTVRSTARNAIIVSGRIRHGDSVYENAMRLQLLENGTVLGVGEGEDYGNYVRCKQ